MTNEELLTYTGTRKQLLREIERQKLLCLQIALNPMPCVCGHLVNQVEASGKSLNEFPAGNSASLEFRCPRCKLRLHEVVPFIGPPYQWRADEGELKSRLGIE